MSEREALCEARPSESWENVFTAFDIKEGYSGMVMRSIKRHLPSPEISPYCSKNGHKWRQIPSLFPQQYFKRSWTDLYGCERCAKRGMVVLRTDGFEAS